MTTLIDTSGSVFRYEFDGEGNRQSQALNDCLATRFVHDGPDVLLELNPANAVTYAWINGPGIDQPIERLLFIDGAPRARRVFHADALGSVAALTDPSGLVAQSYAYSAFGTLRSSAGPDLNRVTYTAREHLGDSQGWMYCRARIYAATIARFGAMDPLDFVDGVNVFSYVNNNPMNLFDPFGLRTHQIGLTANAGAGSGATISVGVAWSSSPQDGFNIGGYFSLGAGAHMGFSAGAGGEYQWSNNDNIDDLSGMAMMYGTDSPVYGIVGGGTDVQCPITGESSPVFSGSLTIGANADVHSYGTHTWIFNPKRYFLQIVEKVKSVFDR